MSDEASSIDAEATPKYGALRGVSSKLEHLGGAVSSTVGGTVGGVTNLAGSTLHGVKNLSVGAKNLSVGAVSSLAYAGLSGAETLAEGYGKGLTMYDKLFLKHINKDFGDHLEVASRGACFVVLCAIPFVTPAEFCPTCQHIVQDKIYTSACITYFIYTLYLYTGDIIHFAQGGVVGTVLAVVNIWLMQGFMPGGYTSDMPHRWYGGVLWGIMFTFFILWLNFDDNTKIFGLSTYVWYWMSFLTPDAVAGFSQNFQIRLDGKAVGEFMVAAIGCGIAVLAAYVPYPIYAHTRALETTKNMVTQAYMTKLDFIEYYSGGKADEMQVRVLAREMETLRNDTGSIASLLDSSWYEEWSGKWQRQRVMMQKFSEFVANTVALMSNVFNICQAETFDPDHIRTMECIKESLQTIVDSNAEVLKYCLAALYEGSWSEEMQDVCAKEVAIGLEGVRSLTTKMQASRIETGYNQVSEVSSGENVCALTFGKFFHLTEQLLKDLQGEQKVKRSWKSGDGILGLFEPDLLFSFDHMMWTFRNGASIVITFFIGYYGYNKYIDKYNAAIASTVAVLLSKFVGSAMVKNLGRLQGVVIGIVLGNLLYAFLGWCYWWGHLLVGLALYLWTLIGLFLYFHSANYSTVGLLLAVFGAQSLLRPCSNADTEPAGHGMIVNVTVAISVMTIVDIFLSPERASDKALKNFRSAYAVVHDAMHELFDPDVTTLSDQAAAIPDAISAAQSLGNEAALEPRYWRHDWPEAKFNKAISCLNTLRFCMGSIQNIVVNREGQKSTVFKKAINLPAFNDLALALSHHTKSVMEAVAVSCQDRYESDDVFLLRLAEVNTDNMSARKTHGGDHGLTKLCEELNKNQEFLQATNLDDISYDPLADCSLLVESLKAMFLDLDATLEMVVS